MTTPIPSTTTTAKPRVKRGHRSYAYHVESKTRPGIFHVVDAHRLTCTRASMASRAPRSSGTEQSTSASAANARRSRPNPQSSTIHEEAGAVIVTPAGAAHERKVSHALSWYPQWRYPITNPAHRGLHP